MATTTFTTFLTKVRNHMGDNLSGTTTSAGNANKKTFIDSNMAKYEDDYFGGGNENVEWWAYVSSQLRPIKDFTSSTGTFEVYTAFTAQVATSTTYDLYRFNRDDYKVAINQSLYACYPSFYLRVDDETTLDGLGSSDVDYEVPSTFSEFPDLIFKKHTSGDKITYTQITNYYKKLVDGTYKFYANITKDDDILLIGKTHLTQFTTDSSTTELSDVQAETVSYLAASLLCQMQANGVNAEDSGRFEAMATRLKGGYEDARKRTAMPMILPENLDFSWTRQDPTYDWRNG